MISDLTVNGPSAIRWRQHKGGPKCGDRIAAMFFVDHFFDLELTVYRSKKALAELQSRMGQVPIPKPHGPLINPRLQRPIARRRKKSNKLRY